MRIRAQRVMPACHACVPCVHKRVFARRVVHMLLGRLRTSESVRPRLARGFGWLFFLSGGFDSSANGPCALTIRLAPRTAAHAGRYKCTAVCCQGAHAPVREQPARSKQQDSEQHEHSAERRARPCSAVQCKDEICISPRAALRRECNGRRATRSADHRRGGPCDAHRGTPHFA